MQIETLVVTDFYTEGPAIDAEGNIFFTTVTGGKVLKRDPEGEVTVWAESACPNGQRILPNGDHLICDSREGAVLRFDTRGFRVAVAASGECDGMVIRTPNDLSLDTDGFYFTDSVRHTGCVFYAGDNALTRIVARDLDYPNGICLSPDRTRLYVAESYRNRILVIELDDAGVSRRAPEVFCNLPANAQNPLTGNLPDGILLDRGGRLWVAHYGMGSVHVIGSDGDLLATYATGLPLTSNLFLDEDAGLLVVTGGSGEPGPGGVHRLNVGTQLKINE